MELTKEQVQAIDSRLKNNGVNYWDIRIELLDHVVTDIESRLSKGSSLDNAVASAFHYLRLNGNLQELTRQRLFGINKIVKKQYARKIKELLVTPYYLLPILLFICSYLSIYFFSNLFVFKIVTMGILIAPILIGLVSYIGEFLKSRRSGYLVYTSFYIFFAFLILNAFIQFVKPDGIIPVTEATQKLVWVVVTCLNSVFSLAGILVHMKTSKKIKAMKIKLLSL